MSLSVLILACALVMLTDSHAAFCGPDGTLCRGRYRLCAPSGCTDVVAEFDWPNDPDLAACWFIMDDGGNAGDDECNAAADNDLTLGGSMPTAYNYLEANEDPPRITVPQGTRAGASGLEIITSAATVTMADAAADAMWDGGGTPGDLSLFCWIRRDEAPTVWPSNMHFGQYDSTGPTGYYLEFDDAGASDRKGSATVQTASAENTTPNGVLADSTAWHHVGLTYDDDGSKVATIWVNAQKVSQTSVATSTAMAAATATFKLHTFSGASWLDGFLHECVFLRRALTSIEVCALCTCGIYGDANFNFRHPLCSSCPQASQFGNTCG